MREAVLVSVVRTAVGKAPRGALRATRPDDLGAVAVRGALDRVPATRPQRNRRRDHRLRHAGGGAGHERGAHHRPARRLARRVRGHDRQSLLRLRAAIDCSRGRAHPWRRGRGGGCRWRGIDVLCAHGRQQGCGQPVVGLEPSRFLYVDGPYRGARRPALRHIP